MSFNYYHILGVGYNASPDEIKAAYRKLAKIYHPDKNPGNTLYEEHFKRVNEAYHVLADEHQRLFYNLSLLINYYSQEAATTRAHRGPRHRYQYTKSPITYTYTKRTYIQAFLFVLGFAFIVIFFPFTLIKVSSERAHAQGKQYYHAGGFDSTFNRVDYASSDFSTKRVQSCILTAKILIYDFKQYEEAKFYVHKGLKYASHNKDKAMLYFLKAKSFKGLQSYDSAYNYYISSLVYNSEYDSTYYELGEMNTFIFNDYSTAVKNFSNLIKLNKSFKDAYFGKAYCLQQLGEHNKAIEYFTQFLILNENEGMAYFLRGLSQFKINNIDFACEDIKKASALGVSSAKAFITTYCKS